MFSDQSTACSLLPTNGKQDNQQMVDFVPPFTDRLDAALAMNRMTNVEFAAHFGQNGQQLVNRWRSRGKIGQPSVPKVRDLLRRTNIDWLQEGRGEPERFTGLAESSPTYDVRQSYAARLDPSILAKAVEVMDADEYRNGKYPRLKYAVLLLHTCDRLAAGEKQSELIAALYEERGDEHGEQRDGAGARRNGR